MSASRAARLTPPAVERMERVTVTVVLEGRAVTVDRDYLLIRRRSLIAELNAINESLGIRRAERQPIPPPGPDEVICRTPGASGCKG